MRKKAGEKQKNENKKEERSQEKMNQMHNHSEVPRQATYIKHEAPTVTRSQSLTPSEHHINSDTTTPMKEQNTHSRNEKQTETKSTANRRTHGTHRPHHTIESNDCRIT